MDVVLVRYPSEQATRERLAAEGVPRLLLVETGAAAPVPEGVLEDWIRVPALDADVRVRLETLASRAGAVAATRPVLDADGVLRLNGSWVSLPPVEARLARVLVDRQGAVVSRESLGRAGWSGGAPGRNALDVHVLRLRRRLGPIGLVIRTVRSRGYVLDRAPHDLLGEAEA